MSEKVNNREKIETKYIKENIKEWNLLDEGEGAKNRIRDIKRIEKKIGKEELFVLRGFIGEKVLEDIKATWSKDIFYVLTDLIDDIDTRQSAFDDLGNSIMNKIEDYYHNPQKENLYSLIMDELNKFLENFNK